MKLHHPPYLSTLTLGLGLLILSLSSASTVAVQPPASATDSIAVGENMIQNPGFEVSPDNWNRNNWAKNDVEFALDSQNPHSGKVSQRVTIRKTLGEVANLELNSAPVPVKPGMVLKLSFWTRGAANTASIKVILRRAHVPYRTYFEASVALTDSWKESNFVLVVPPTVDDSGTYLQFVLAEEGTFWIDDVSLAPFSPPELPPMVGNLVKNGSFEVGQDHWYAGFRQNAAAGHVDSASLTVQPEAGAPQGKNVLSINLPANNTGQLTSAYLKLRPSHPYSLRFWLKSPQAENEFKVCLGQGKYPNQSTPWQSLTSTDTGWDFFQCEFTPTPSNSGTYFLDFAFDQAGKYEIDGISMTEGKSTDKTFPPSANPDVGWGQNASAPAGNLFYLKDQISFPLEVATKPGADSVSLRLRLVDFRDREVKQWPVQVPLNAQGEGKVDVALPSDRFGGFKVEAYLENETSDAIPETELIYSVVPKLEPMAQVKDSFFGGHVALTPYNLDIAERLGMRWLRLHPPLTTKWVTVESEKGKFKFNTDDVALAYQRGFHLLSIFDTTPWFYADAPLAEAKKSTWFHSYPPKDWDAWRNYVQKTATAFAPYIQNWEIWNEPDGGFLQIRPGEEKATEYVKIVTQTRKALDDAHIQLNLIGNVAANLGRPFTQDELKLGGGSLVDELSFHFYGEELSPDERKPSLADQLAGMRKFPNRSGSVPPLWMTEGGMWLDDSKSWLRSAQVPTSQVTTFSDTAMQP